MRGDDDDIDSRFAVGGIVTEGLAVKAGDTEKVSWASAQGDDMKRLRIGSRSEVQVLHVVSRLYSSCLMLTIDGDC